MENGTYARNLNNEVLKEVLQVQVMMMMMISWKLPNLEIVSE